MWTGDVPEASRRAVLLLDHSTRHSLPFWQFWGRCLEVALARRSGEMRAGHSVLCDPLCSPTHQESLATVDEGLATQEAIARAENGLAGWCAAELLRVKAEAACEQGRDNSKGVTDRQTEQKKGREETGDVNGLRTSFPPGQIVTRHDYETRNGRAHNPNQQCSPNLPGEQFHRWLLTRALSGVASIASADARRPIRRKQSAC
jgi:hypothetical protein